MSKYTMAGLTRQQMKFYRNLRELEVSIDDAVERARELRPGGTRRTRRLDRERMKRFESRCDGRAVRAFRRHPAHFLQPKSVLLTIRSGQRRWARRSR